MSKKIFLSFLFVLGILSGRFDVKADNSNYLNKSLSADSKTLYGVTIGEY